MRQNNQGTFTLAMKMTWVDQSLARDDWTGQLRNVPPPEAPPRTRRPSSGPSEGQRARPAADPRSPHRRGDSPHPGICNCPRHSNGPSTRRIVPYMIWKRPGVAGSKVKAEAERGSRPRGCSSPAALYQNSVGPATAAHTRFPLGPPRARGSTWERRTA